MALLLGPWKGQKHHYRHINKLLLFCSGQKAEKNRNRPRVRNSHQGNVPRDLLLSAISHLSVPPSYQEPIKDWTYLLGLCPQDSASSLQSAAADHAFSPKPFQRKLNIQSQLDHITKLLRALATHPWRQKQPHLTPLCAQQLPRSAPNRAGDIIYPHFVLCALETWEEPEDSKQTPVCEAEERGEEQKEQFWESLTLDWTWVVMQRLLLSIQQVYIGEKSPEKDEFNSKA